MADDQQPFQEQLAQDAAGFGRPTTSPVAEVERRFWAEVMLLIAPIFLAAWGAIALFALTHGGTQVGTFMGIFWLVVAAATLRQPYVAILDPDGSLTFRALTRSITTAADSVYRIKITGGRGRLYVFHFDDRRAELGDFGGRVLSRYLLERNPTMKGSEGTPVRLSGRVNVSPQFWHRTTGITKPPTSAIGDRARSGSGFEPWVLRNQPWVPTRVWVRLGLCTGASMRDPRLTR